MAVTGKYLCIALFVVLQITVGLCRSTESPLNGDKGSTVKVNTDKAQNADAVPRQMSYTDYYETYEDNGLNGFAIFCIVMGTILVFSILIGWIIYLCRKKQSRRGYVIISNYGGQPSAIQQAGNMMPGGYGMRQSIPDNPPPYEQTTVEQQWNTYQAVHATKH